eukprot:5487878-Prymnesium_polylepis.1
MGQGPFGPKHFALAAVAGGICCSLTHGALTPVDVVKTRIQLDPATYDRGFIGAFQQIIASEGAAALLTGLGATAQGYFIQGWFKFGGVEYFKIVFTRAAGDQAAWESRDAIYLLSSACAEVIADLFLCPFEACRIRLVSQPDYATSLVGTAQRLVAEQGFGTAFYSGLLPMFFKQVPYTMAKFAVQGRAAEAVYSTLGASPKSTSRLGNVAVSLLSGVVAGVVAAIISHPADTLLSKINKGGAGGSGSMLTRMANIVSETGLLTLCTQGLLARCVMIGVLTAGQFGVFDIVMNAVGAKKFHFHDPAHYDPVEWTVLPTAAGHGLAGCQVCASLGRAVDEPADAGAEDGAPLSATAHRSSVGDRCVECS